MFFTLKINHILYTSLFLLLIVEEGFTCSWHKGSWYNRPRRELQKSNSNYGGKRTISVSDRTLSAEEQNVKNEANIEVALRHLYEVLLNDNEEKKSIDRKVIEYFSKGGTFSLRSPISEHHKPSAEYCSEVKIHDIPRPSGQSFHKKLTSSHFMINIPRFNQTADAYKCTNIDKSCLAYDSRKLRASLGKCKQKENLANVLVLPNTKQYFDISDFKVTTYRVPGRCTCARNSFNPINIAK